MSIHLAYVTATTIFETNETVKLNETRYQGYILGAAHVTSLRSG